MPTEKKIKTVELYKEQLEKSKGLFIVDYKGVTVEEINAIRRKFDECNAKYKVIKNSLFKIATQGTDFDTVTTDLVGTNGVIFIEDDPVAVAKTLNNILKDYSSFQYKTGILEGKIVEEASLKALAQLPPREVLQAQLLALFVAPATNMVNLLSATPRNFLNLLNAYKATKEN